MEKQTLEPFSGSAGLVWLELQQEPPREQAASAKRGSLPRKPPVKIPCNVVKDGSGR